MMQASWSVSKWNEDILLLEVACHLEGRLSSSGGIDAPAVLVGVAVRQRTTHPIIEGAGPRVPLVAR